MARKQEYREIDFRNISLEGMSVVPLSSVSAVERVYPDTGTSELLARLAGQHSEVIVREGLFVERVPVRIDTERNALVLVDFDSTVEAANRAATMLRLLASGRLANVGLENAQDKDYVAIERVCNPREWLVETYAEP